MSQTQGFKAVVNEQTRVLILGSHPGIISLRKQQYYGNPGNAFWRVVFNALELIDPVDYAQRVEMLLANGIGLWDVYASVERAGSLDSNIKHETLNDFESILHSGTVQLIIANGKKAYNEIQKHPIFDSIEVVSGLSTSGANNGRQNERAEQWYQAIRDGLGLP